MTKRKILIVTGAGSTIDFGMPSVWQVGEVIKAEMQKVFPLANRPNANLYGFVESSIRRHWNNVPSYLRRDPNFEDVLYAVFAASGLLSASASASGLGALVKTKKLPDFRFFDREPKSVDRFELYNLGSFAVDAILADVRERCRIAERDRSAQFGELQSFVSELQKTFDVAVVTLNYDNVLYRALPNIEIGFDPRTGRFQDERLFFRVDWPCMLHLHGSVHFDMPTPSKADMHEIFWQPDIDASFAQNSSGRSRHPNPEGTEFPTSAIVAGYGKSMQLVRRPFRSYYAELDRLVASCDALLLAGYGFGDQHLNVAFERFRDARRRPVVILDYAKRGSSTLGGFEDQALATAVVHTFQTDLHSMRWLGHSVPGEVDALIDAADFETSNDPATPLSVWYGGMTEACRLPDKLIARLK
ncbi:SIR2 family protein [Mesorhizobium sp. IMUNJ 23033]|uniref:SIR2 family protein n=1 Tax=Mesorhizobium sp. IMUNJ 23033 TaxID=3378039 RepID=UPI00384C7DE8